MRISTHQMQQFAIDSMLRQQVKVSKTQLQLASGKRVLTPSDDPVASTQILQLRQMLDTAQQYKVNGSAARDRLETQETVLGSVMDALQRIREQTVRALNATETDQSQAFIAAEVRQRLDELLSLANTKDGKGEFLFAGSQVGVAPFVKDGDSYRYDGDQTVRSLQIGPNRRITDGESGAAAFQLIRNGNGFFVTELGGNEAGGPNLGTAKVSGTTVDGNFQHSLPDGYTVRFVQADPSDPVTYEVRDSDDVVVASGTYGSDSIEFRGARLVVTGTPVDGDTIRVTSSAYQDLFTTVERLATLLETPVNSSVERAAQTNDLSRALGDIDQAMNNILVIRANIGAKLNAIDSEEYATEGNILQYRQILSSLEDLDYAEAISNLSTQMAGLQAAQQAYLKVEGLSMFNFMR